VFAPAFASWSISFPFNLHVYQQHYRRVMRDEIVKIFKSSSSVVSSALFPSIDTIGEMQQSAVPQQQMANGNQTSQKLFVRTLNNKNAYSRKI